MLKKFLVMSCLISFCSGIGINAAETSNCFGNAVETSKSQGCSVPGLVISNFTSFALGAAASYAVTKQFDGNEEKIKDLKSKNDELKKNIVDKTQLEDLKKEVAKLQSENNRLNEELKSLTDIWGTGLNLDDMKKAKKLYDWSNQSKEIPGSYYNLIDERNKRLKTLFGPFNRLKDNAAELVTKFCFGVTKGARGPSSVYNFLMDVNITDDERRQIFGGLIEELGICYKDFKFAIKGQ